MGIYVAKASAIRDLLMKHYPEARSPCSLHARHCSGLRADDVHIVLVRHSSLTHHC